jgi:heme/copper-type cytochrome/quinol oxidase subunit 4
MAQTSWTFAVIFIAIGATIVVFGAMWLRSQLHLHREPRRDAERLGPRASAR